MHNIIVPDVYKLILLLCPGKNFEFGSTHVFAEHTAMQASPVPVAMSLNFPS